MDNKIMKTAATLTGLVAGFGWAKKKLLKTSMTSDPSVSIENYVETAVVLAGAICLKDYLVDKKIIPS